TVVEAENAMHSGNVGHLTNVWRVWALMAHGLKTLPQYTLHLTWFMVLLEQDLPKLLAKVIMHMLLIPSSECPGHYVANDLYLEIQNYWLKKVYNQ
ncbi:hypothetical protein CROQUDRAFT_22242, partial [Cronartium quercuum f. sp. fusiforme G11]